MSKRFVPVSDPEKARCEQDENDLRKHRQFDTPFALLAKDLNNPREAKGDKNPIAKRSDDLYQDDKGLWKKKKELFQKEQTWGRETEIWSNPEETRDQDKRKYKPGEVFWGAKGNWGSKQADEGLLTLQRGEVDQGMELNEKGLWVKRKKTGEAQGEGAGLSDSAKQLLKAAPKNGEDPRLEAAAKKGRGGPDASKKALEALEERRKLEKKVQDEMGMTKGRDDRKVQYAAQHSSRDQVKPAKRQGGVKRWQTVHRTDEEAKDVVEKAIGSEAVGGTSSGMAGAGAVKRAEHSADPLAKRHRKRSPSPVVMEEPSDDEEGGNPAWMDSDDEKEASKVSGKASGGDVVVDFF